MTNLYFSTETGMDKAKMRRVVTLLSSAAAVEERDAEEFFDYCVPSALFGHFLRATPHEVLRSQFVDLRFLAMIKKMAPLDTIDFEHHGTKWLIAHHAQSLDAKMRNFDRAGTVSEVGATNVLERASRVSASSLSAVDAELAKSFDFKGPRLSPQQVMTCRLHYLSLAIQYYAFDDRNYAGAKAFACKDTNKLYGEGFGDALFSICEAWLKSCFTAEHEALSRKWMDDAETLTNNLRAMVGEKEIVSYSTKKKL